MANNHFDEIAKEWDADSFRTRLARGIAASIRENANIRGRVLDFGCGTGLISFALSDLAGEIVGVDSSSAMVDEFNAKAKKYSLPASAKVLSETENLPDPHYDVIVSGMVFHHVEDIPNLLRRLYDGLAPGGILAAADLDSEDGSFHPPEMEGIFHKGFDRRQMASWFEQAGFESVKTADAGVVEREEKEYGIFLTTGKKPLNG